VITHAFVPAIISYIALVYIVHLEAVKMDMPMLKKFDDGSPAKTVVQKLIGFLSGFLLVCGVAFGVYYGLGWIKPILGDSAFFVISATLIAIYVFALKFGSNYPVIEPDDPNEKNIVLPAAGPIFKAGMFYLLPVIVLVWGLMVERLSPGLSAYYASIFIMLMIVTRPFLEAMFRKNASTEGQFKQGFVDLMDGMITGSKNMIGIAIATATAGIIVGAVSQTSVGSVLADVVEVLSMGNIFLMLVLVAILCMILGMGLPTTANYIVVSSLMATVIVEVGASNGLIIPLVAVHLFVFYFGLMADVTPPVGLASFAAAAVSGGDPIKTGVVAFVYALRTAVLPFLFVYNTDLLLINVTYLQGFGVFFLGTCAILAFTAATQGYFFAKNNIVEGAVLMLCALLLFRAGIVIDLIQDPYTKVESANYQETAGDVPAGALLRFNISGEDDFGNPKTFVSQVKLGEGATIDDRLASIGMTVVPAGDHLEVDTVEVGSEAYRANLQSFQLITSIEVPNDQPSRIFVWIPTFIVLFLLARLQKARQRKIDMDKASRNAGTSAA
jgi:TRAP transporter 4TM/12TM fusion protein